MLDDLLYQLIKLSIKTTLIDFTPIRMTTTKKEDIARITKCVEK